MSLNETLYWLKLGEKPAEMLNSSGYTPAMKEGVYRFERFNALTAALSFYF